MLAPSCLPSLSLTLQFVYCRNCVVIVCFLIVWILLIGIIYCVKVYLL